MKHLINPDGDQLPEYRGPWAGTKNDPERLAAAVGSRSPAFGATMLRQAIASLSAVGSMSEEDYLDMCQSVLTVLEEIAPRNVLEGQLAVQMVSTHNAAEESMRRARLADRPPGSRHVHLKDGATMMRLYLQQLEALAKLRGRGHQKITVEHVTVEAGGQAIVGDVSVAKGNGGLVGDGQPGDAGAGPSERSPAQKVRVRQRARSR